MANFYALEHYYVGVEMIRVFCGLILSVFAMSSQAGFIGVGQYVDTDEGFILGNNGLSASDTEIEAFLGLQTGILDSISTGNATAGSAVKTTLDVSAGDVISFDWLWQSSESSSSYYNDFAFYSISIGSIAILADTFLADGTQDAFSWVANQSGSLTFGLGVLDLQDTIVSSYLNVSDFNVSKVPEPSSVALLMMGVAGLFYTRNRSKKVEVQG